MRKKNHLKNKDQLWCVIWEYNEETRCRMCFRSARQKCKDNISFIICSFFHSLILLLTFDRYVFSAFCDQALF